MSKLHFGPLQNHITRPSPLEYRAKRRVVRNKGGGEFAHSSFGRNLAIRLEYLEKGVLSSLLPIHVLTLTWHSLRQPQPPQPPQPGATTCGSLVTRWSNHSLRDLPPQLLSAWSFCTHPAWSFCTYRIWSFWFLLRGLFVLTFITLPSLDLLYRT